MKIPRVFSFFIAPVMLLFTIIAIRSGPILLDDYEGNVLFATSETVKNIIFLLFLLIFVLVLYYLIAIAKNDDNEESQ